LEPSIGIDGNGQDGLSALCKSVGAGTGMPVAVAEQVSAPRLRFADREEIPYRFSVDN
jgi:hypothetical protein